MTAHPAAPLLAADLGRLPHTNTRGEKGIIQLPGFMSTAGMSEQQAQDAGLLAQAIAEAIIEDLEKHGYQVLTKAQIDAKVKAATADKPADEAILYCSRCHQRVIGVDMRATAPKINVKLAVAALAAHAEVCK